MHYDMLYIFIGMGGRSMVWNKFDIPEWFTPEKYKEYKDQGITDIEIAEEKLFVSLSTLKRFKKDLGIVSKRGGSKPKHRRKLNYDAARELHKQGYAPVKIAEILNCPRTSIYNAFQ